MRRVCNGKISSRSLDPRPENWQRRNYCGTAADRTMRRRGINNKQRRADRCYLISDIVSNRRRSPGNRPGLFHVSPSGETCHNIRVRGKGSARPHARLRQLGDGLRTIPLRGGPSRSVLMRPKNAEDQRLYASELRRVHRHWSKRRA
jgi:hypothetical protein